MLFESAGNEAEPGPMAGRPDRKVD